MLFARNENCAVLCGAQDAVLVGHLKSATYQRLMVAVIAKSTLYLGAFLMVSKALDTALRHRQPVSMLLWNSKHAAIARRCVDCADVTALLKGTFAATTAACCHCCCSCFCCCCLQSPEVWNPVLVSFYPTSAAASIAINVATLQTAFKQAGADSFGSGLQGMWGFGTPKTPASWGYTLSIVLYIATGVSQLAAHEATSSNGRRTNGASKQFLSSRVAASSGRGWWTAAANYWCRTMWSFLVA